MVVSRLDRDIWPRPPSSRVHWREGNCWGWGAPLLRGLWNQDRLAEYDCKRDVAYIPWCWLLFLQLYPTSMWDCGEGERAAAVPLCKGTALHQGFGEVGKKEARCPHSSWPRRCIVNNIANARQLRMQLCAWSTTFCSFSLLGDYPTAVHMFPQSLSNRQNVVHFPYGLKMLDFPFF